MATTLFDRPLFVQRKHYVEEIASLEEAFDLLEGWPDDKRGLAHDILMEACQKAANGEFPITAIRNNLERFLKKAELLAAIEDVPSFTAMASAQNLGNA